MREKGKFNFDIESVRIIKSEILSFFRFFNPNVWRKKKTVSHGW